MMPWFAVVAALVVITVAALVWGIQQHRKLARLSVMYQELFSTQVKQPLIAWQETRETDPAEIKVSWIRSGTAAYRVTLENVGPVAAEELQFNLMSSNGYCPLEPEMMSRLFPVRLGAGEKYTLFALPSRWMTDPFWATLMWQDAAGNRYNANSPLVYESNSLG